MMATSGVASVEALMQQSPSIPGGRTNVACCCGRPSCAYLSHNNAALDDLEKDVRTAAQLGQVCSPLETDLETLLLLTMRMVSWLVDIRVWLGILASLHQIWDDEVCVTC